METLFTVVVVALAALSLYLFIRNRSSGGSSGSSGGSHGGGQGGRRDGDGTRVDVEP